MSIFDSYDDALATALTSYPDFIRFYDSATDLREEMAKIIVNKSGINFFLHNHTTHLQHPCKAKQITSFDSERQEIL